jgi:hypothetical protein
MKRTKEPPSSNVGKYIQLVGVILACGTLAFSYMKKEGLWFYADTQPLGDFARGENGAGQAHAGNFAGLEKDEKIKEQGKFTELVRGAIVTVTTSWGQGIGFFFRENTLITGRHLVEPDLDKIARLEEQVARNKKILQLEEIKLANYHTRLSKMRRRRDKEARNLLIAEREEYLAGFRVQQERDEQELSRLKKAQEQLAIDIRLANGGKQQATLVQTSKDYDLALLRVPLIEKNPVLKPLPLDVLLSLDSPVFIPENIITDDKKWADGTFLGYRRVGKDNRMYLQIAVKLSQQKSSGSPVVDGAGTVLAVVIQTGLADQASVFALPIDKVFDEFVTAFE